MTGIVLAALGGGVGALAAYQLVVALAAFLYRPSAPGDGPAPRLTVLVPAHDEEALVARCVRSLHDQSYAAEIVVVADNCTDGTATVAAAAGARVLVRDEPGARGKGRALAWALERILREPEAPDAVAVVDADSVAGPDFLELLVRPLTRGAAAAQAESLLVDDGSPAASFRASAFLLVNRVRPGGRAVLGLPCGLAGNGMIVRSDVLRAHPWDAFSSTEDVEYGVKLRLAGIRPAFAGGAVISSPAAPNAAAAEAQQLRWEGGKVHVARTLIPRLLAAAVRRRSLWPLDAALELAVPPLGLLAAVTVAGTAVGGALALAGLVPLWALAPWLAALAGIPLYVLVGLRAARAPASAYRSLLRAPLFVVTKLLHAHRLFTFNADTWVRTER